jgi:predicted amidophosphoribosyltransferase
MQDWCDMNLLWAIVDLVFPPHALVRSVRNCSVIPYAPHLQVDIPVTTLCASIEMHYSALKVLKFYRGWHAHKLFVSIVVAHLHAHAVSTTLVTSIPPSRTRLSERGYDHVAEVCQVACKKTGMKYYPLLTRLRETSRQTTLGRADRLVNVRDAFGVAHRRPNPATTTIIVIDDVCTTGSTLSEASRALQDLGYTVHAVALVRAQHSATSTH